jgi:hypothetical protein
MTRHASSPSTATHGLRNRSRPQSSKRRHSKLSSPRVRDASWPTRRPNLAPLRPDASPSVSTSASSNTSDHPPTPIRSRSQAPAWLQTRATMRLALRRVPLADVHGPTGKRAGLLPELLWQSQAALRRVYRPQGRHHVDGAVIPGSIPVPWLLGASGRA